MIAKLEQLKKEILEKLETVKDGSLLAEIENKYLSRNGELNTVLKNIKDLGAEARQEAGQLANQIKSEILKRFTEVKTNVEGGDDSEIEDITLPGARPERGHLHPITAMSRELIDIFTSLGFMVIEGPELESDYYSFQALNIPEHHPARDMQDTFYIDKKNDAGNYDLVMRPHTSAYQVRLMEKYGAPLKAIIPGRCFRSEATDARHEHTFYQLEGLIIDKNINFGHIKGILELIGQKIGGPQTKLRMRPKFYPFVEPGSNGEYTCLLCGGKGCKVCKNSGWLEIVGCGLIHPEVLRAGGIDPNEYSGLAFGFGLTRLAQLKYGVEDVRLFNSGDLRFLNQF